MDKTTESNWTNNIMNALPAASVASLAVLGLAFLWCCPDLPHAAKTLGEHWHFNRQLAWNAVGIVAFAGMLKLGWDRLLKAAPFVFAGWIALFVAAQFCPTVNGSLYAGIGPVRINVMACLPFAAALLLAWTAQTFKFRAARFLLVVALAFNAALAIKIMDNPNRTARVVAFIKGETAMPPSEAAYARMHAQRQYAQSLEQARWFSGNEEALQQNLIPDRRTTGVPVASALLFGKWFAVLVWGLYGLFAIGMIRCWWSADCEAKKVFALIGGSGVLVPAILAYGGCMALTPMTFVCAPLLSFGGTQVLTAWLAAAVLTWSSKC